MLVPDGAPSETDEGGEEKVMVAMTSLPGTLESKPFSRARQTQRERAQKRYRGRAGFAAFDSNVFICHVSLTLFPFSTLSAYLALCEIEEQALPNDIAS